MAASLPGLSRNELGKTVCEHLGWKTKQGRSRVRLAVRVLEELERLGVQSRRPLQLQLAQASRRSRSVQEWVQRYHPRGSRKPLGAHLRYVVRWPAGTSGSGGRAKHSTGT